MSTCTHTHTCVRGALILGNDSSDSQCIKMRNATRRQDYVNNTILLKLSEVTRGAHEGIACNNYQKIS